MGLVRKSLRNISSGLSYTFLGTAVISFLGATLSFGYNQGVKDFEHSTLHAESCTLSDGSPERKLAEKLDAERREAFQSLTNETQKTQQRYLAGLLASGVGILVSEFGKQYFREKPSRLVA